MIFPQLAKSYGIFNWVDLCSQTDPLFFKNISCNPRLLGQPTDLRTTKLDLGEVVTVRLFVVCGTSKHNKNNSTHGTFFLKQPKKNEINKPSNLPAHPHPQQKKNIKNNSKPTKKTPKPKLGTAISQSCCSSNLGWVNTKRLGIFALRSGYNGTILAYGPTGSGKPGS